MNKNFPATFSFSKLIGAVRVLRQLGFLLTTVPLLAADAIEAPPWKSNKPIVTVKKELFWKHPRPLAAATAYDEYVGPKLERKEVRGLEIADDVGSEMIARFSSDNGRTWVDFKAVEDNSPELKGLRRRTSGLRSNFGSCSLGQRAERPQ
jgi:hypothetical protein